MKAHEFISETPLPPDWDGQELIVKKGNTFRSRLMYALERAKRVGTGSSRVAMIIPFEGRKTVLKVAKNKKGIAQNYEEVKILNDGVLGRSPIVIPLIDYDKTHENNIAWLQTELAVPFKSEAELMRYFGLHPSDVVYYAQSLKDYILSKSDRKKDIDEMLATMSEDMQERFHFYANEMASLTSGSELDLDDFTWYKNWGMYDGRAVILDVGFSGSVLPLYGY